MQFNLGLPKNDPIAGVLRVGRDCQRYAGLLLERVAQADRPVVSYNLSFERKIFESSF